MAFTDRALILYILMWRTIGISWWGVQYIVSSDVTYIFFSRITEQFLLRRTSCISWCDILPVFPVVEYNTLYLLVWHIYCSSDINNISWYGVLPFFSYVAYFLYFLMWCTLHCVSSYGVYIVRQISMMFPGMSHSLFFLMWLVSCISWCGVHYIVAPEVEYILFCRYT